MPILAPVNPVLNLNVDPKTLFNDPLQTAGPVDVFSINLTSGQLATASYIQIVIDGIPKFTVRVKP